MFDSIMKALAASGGGMGGGFGAMGGMGGGGLLQRLMKQPGAAPAVPGDGAMGPTIGPGAPAPAAPPVGPVKFGLPQGGIMGLLQGTPPQGLIGMLQRGVGGSPLAGNMPQAGMNPVPQPGLPMNIDPTTQF